MKIESDVCRVPGCGRPRYPQKKGSTARYSLCGPHRERKRKYGGLFEDVPIGEMPPLPRKPRTPPPPKPRGLCETPGCGKPQKRRRGGWRPYCSACDKRRESEKNEKKACEVPDCTNHRFQARRYCGPHAYRLRKYGTLEPPQKPPPLGPTCAAEGCERERKRGGRRPGSRYCAAHWARLHTYGDVFASIPVPARNGEVKAAAEAKAVTP